MNHEGLNQDFLSGGDTLLLFLPLPFPLVFFPHLPSSSLSSLLLPPLPSP